MTFDGIRRAVRACVCDGYEGLSCDVVGDECAMREPERPEFLLVPRRCDCGRGTVCPGCSRSAAKDAVGAGSPMADPTWGKALLELGGPLLANLNLHRSALMDALAHSARELKERDDAYLASLTPTERRKVLALRTIHKKRRRVERWLDDNVTWRFAKERPDDGW